MKQVVASKMIDFKEDYEGKGKKERKIELGFWIWVLDNILSVWCVKFIFNTPQNIYYNVKLFTDFDLPNLLIKLKIYFYHILKLKYEEWFK